MQDSTARNPAFPDAFVETGVQLDASVIIGPGAVVLRGRPDAPTAAGVGVTIGANATILGGVQLGGGCVVEPGAVVKQDVPARVVVAGNPAMIVGYTKGRSPDRPQKCCALAEQELAEQIDRDLLSNGTRLVELALVLDLRGSLSVSDFKKDLPFRPLRSFLIFDVPSAEVRGEHAHRDCHQFLLCVAGRLNVVVDDGTSRQEVTLERRHVGLYMPPMTWGVQYKYSADGVLMVLASHSYDAADYIRDYSQFTALTQRDAP